jgi:hypothetical protein
VLGAVAMLAPRFSPAQEWASASMSSSPWARLPTTYLAVGDGADILVAPIIFTGVAAAFWALKNFAQNVERLGRQTSSL